MNISNTLVSKLVVISMNITGILAVYYYLKAHINILFCKTLF